MFWSGRCLLTLAWGQKSWPRRRSGQWPASRAVPLKSDSSSGPRAKTCSQGLLSLSRKRPSQRWHRASLLNYTIKTTVCFPPVEAACKKNPFFFSSAARRSVRKMRKNNQAPSAPGPRGLNAKSHRTRSLTEPGEVALVHRRRNNCSSGPARDWLETEKLTLAEPPPPPPPPPSNRAALSSAFSARAL